MTSFPTEMMAHWSFTGQQSEDPGLDSNTKLNPRSPLKELPLKWEQKTRE